MGAPVSAAASVIAAADPDEHDSLGALQGIRFTEAGTEAARLAIEAGATGDALWAATWVYVSGADDPAPLIALLEQDDASIRLLAAAGISSLGVAEGLSVLAAGVDGTDTLRGSEPPISTGSYAAGVLRMLTGSDPGTAGWSAWLAENLARLTYDKEARAWSVP